MSTAAFELSAGGRVIYAEPVAERARELFAADWPKKRIGEILAKEFGLPTVPTRNTVTAWVEPDKHARWEHAQQQRRLTRIRCNTVSVVQGADRSLAWKLERMRQLSAAGLSANAIASVMNLDFPRDEPLGHRHVRTFLETGQPTGAMRRKASA
jgi:hypothetical protein